MDKEMMKSDHETRGVNERRQARFVWLSEATMVAVCVLVFFGFLSILIRVFFPEGRSLIADPTGSVIVDTSWRGDVELGIDTIGGNVEQLFAGEILKIQRRVQQRGANTLAWNDASIGDKIVRNDAVQTFTRSTALLEINDKSRLTIGENSLIVFDQQQADPFLRGSNSVLVMIDGELSGTLSTADRSRFRFGVNLPNGDVVLKPGKSGDDVEFLITVNSDRSTTVNIHNGTAQIVATDGTMRTIGDNQTITIDSSGTELRVSELSRNFRSSAAPFR